MDSKGRPGHLQHAHGGTLFVDEFATMSAELQVIFLSILEQRDVERVGGDLFEYVVYDTNFWKSFVHARLAVSMGDPGSLALFGRKPETHRLIAEHLTAEYRVRTQGRGRTVDEWKVRASGLDNHWLDCLVGAAVAASMQGAVLFGTDTRPTSKPRIRLSELRRQRS